MQIVDDFWPDKMDHVEVQLEPEPDNEFDDQAVAVYAWVPLGPLSGQRHKVGYVPRGVNAQVRRAIEAGKVGAVRFAEMGVTSGKKPVAWAKLGLAASKR